MTWHAGVRRQKGGEGGGTGPELELRELSLHIWSIPRETIAEDTRAWGPYIK
jgi:hypothetical protein